MQRFAASLGSWVLVVGCLFSLGTAGTIRDDRPDARYLRLGASERYESVGQFLGRSVPNGDYDFGASGVLISDDWVLTAAHVVWFGSIMDSWEFQIDGQTYTPVDWVPFPDFVWDAWAGNDVGMVKLSATPPEEIDRAEFYEGRRELGRVGTAVGYGATGTGLTGANMNVGVTDLRKRAGRNMLDANTVPGMPPLPDDTPRLLFSDFDNPHNPADNKLGSPRPLNLEYMIAPGDSGGGLFIKDKLVGINSFGLVVDRDHPSVYGEVSGHVRVAPYVDWIEGILEADADQTAGEDDTVDGDNGDDNGDADAGDDENDDEADEGDEAEEGEGEGHHPKRRHKKRDRGHRGGRDCDDDAFDALGLSPEELDFWLNESGVLPEGMAAAGFFSNQTAAVPEPSGLLLLIVGALGVLGWSRRRAKAG